MTTRALLMLLAIVLALGTGTAQQASPLTDASPAMFQYAVKFICGSALQVPNNLNAVAAPGTYFTAINVHNPARAAAVTLHKKFAIGLPSEVAGKVSPYFSAALGADETLQIECTDIRRHLQNPPGAFLEGFAVIESSQDLDVDTVYSAGAGSPLQVTSIHTVRSQPRKLPACGPINIDLSTGVAQWRLLSGPSTAPGPFPRPANSFTSPQGAIAGTSFVGPNATGESPALVALPSTWEYETCFCLCAGFQNVKLTVAGIKPDDNLSLSLNGSPIPGFPELPVQILHPAATTAQLSTINASSNKFFGGKNCLRVRVVDTVKGLTGFDLKATVSGAAASCQ